MSKQHSKRSVIIGLFILLALAILVAGVMLLGGQQKRFVKTVPINAIFDDVSGLKAGDNVWFSGVKIGTVQHIQFVGQSKVQVDMNVEEKSREFIRKDARCHIGSDGLIGNKVINITGGSQRAAPVENNDQLQTQIMAGSEQLLDTLQITNRKLLSITTKVEQIVAQVGQGKGTAGALLTDTVLSGQVHAIVTSLKATAVNANRLSGTLAGFSAKLNTPGTLAHALVTDTVVINNLRASARQLRKAATSTAVITDNARKLTDKLQSTDNALGSLLNDHVLNKRVQNTLRNVESSSTKLDEDLEAVQHNFLLRGFFRRKAKQTAQKKQNEPGDSVHSVN